MRGTRSTRPVRARHGRPVLAWRGRSVVAAMLAVLCLGAVGACESSPSPSPWPDGPTLAPGSTAGAVSSITGAVPTTGTTAAPVFPEGVPDAARVHDPRGAEAFVRYFLDQVNVAWSLPMAGLLPPLCAPTSKACTGLESTAGELVAKHQRYDGPPVTVQYVDSLGLLNPNDSAFSVNVLAVQELRHVIDSNGNVVLTDARKPLHNQVDLTWTPSGWQVRELGTVR